MGQKTGEISSAVGHRLARASSPEPVGAGGSGGLRRQALGR